VSRLASVLLLLLVASTALGATTCIKNESNCVHNFPDGVQGPLFDMGGAIFNAGAYGMKCNGSADDAAALTATIAAAQSVTFPSIYKIVVMPAGRCVIGSTISLVGVNSLTLLGKGKQQVTQLQWVGNNSTPFVYLGDVRDSVFGDFRMTANGSTFPLLEFWQLENTTSAPSVTPTHNIFGRLDMNGQNANGVQDCFIFTIGSGGDNNNDLHSFEHVQCSNYMGAAWHNLTKNATGLTMWKSSCSAQNNVGTNCVHSTAGSGGQVASYEFVAGSTSLNAVDFQIDAVTADAGSQPIIIDGVESETSGRFLAVAASNFTIPITIRGVRYHASGGLNADKDAILAAYPGPLLIEGSTFDTNSSASLPHIHMASAVRPVALTAKANLFMTQNSISQSPWIIDAPSTPGYQLDIKGNMFRDNSNNPSANLVMAAGTTPQVFMGDWFQSSGTALITNLLGGWPGAIKVITCVDGTTSFVHNAAGPIILTAGANYTCTAGHSITFMFDGTNWRDLAKN
jgi:hypothetical protein